MKQGPSTSRSGDQKREPIPNAVSEEAVSDIGAACSYTKTTLYKGRGYKAPMAGEETHHCGSQGKH